MSPQAIFMMTVQTLVLRSRGDESTLALSEAASIPEEAYANARPTVAFAAVQWWEWRRTKIGKPAWLEAHEEGQRAHGR